MYRSSRLSRGQALTAYNYIFYLVERDTDGECMFVWVYPSINENLKKLVLTKCNTITDDYPDTRFCFCQSQGIWYYILRSDASQGQLLKNVCHFYFLKQTKITPLSPT